MLPLYAVDAHSNVTLANLTNSNTVGGYAFHGSSILKDLAEGNHTLNVYSQDDSVKEMYTSVEFMIDTHFLIPVSNHVSEKRDLHDKQCVFNCSL